VWARNCLLSLLILLLQFSVRAQLPPIQWANQYGGSGVDIPLTIIPTNDLGTLVAGYTDSKDGDVSNIASREYWDLWVTKLDRCGTIQWQKTWGGSGYESARDILQLNDGGYFILGETNSTDGNVCAGFGGTKDMWLLRLDDNGNLLWQKRYGGNGLDIGNRIAQLPDGNFLVTMSTSSNDGNISGNHGTGGYTDAAVLKIDGNGNILFSKCFGGSKNEELLDFVIINNKIYLGGYANSTDGDIPPSQLNYDVWLLAIDMNGNKIFSKVYGGSQNDVAYSMTTGIDGSLTLAGYSTSTDGPVTGARGSQDYWIINIGTNGSLNWQTVAGGTEADYANSILTDTDGGYLVAGISYSADGDVSHPKGEGDYWIVKLSPDGKILWEQSFGGSGNDNLRTIRYAALSEEYYLSGDSDSGDGDFSNPKMEADYAIIKLKQIKQEIIDSAVCNLNDFVSPIDTLRDACGFDSIYLNYRPVPLQKAFDKIRNRDTIFRGESIQLHASGNGIITWSADPSLSCLNCPDPVASPVNSTTYHANSTLPGGCSTSDEFTVVVLDDAILEIPTGFTPNGDGRNDLFGPVGKVPEGFSMMIYHRNGELVFRSSAIATKWNGAFHQQAQPNAVYVYIIEYKDLKGRKYMRKGTVTLIR